MIRINSAKKIAFLALMLAVILTLSFLEHMIPPVPFLPPGVKLGLSNIAVMYCVFFVGKPQAFALNALKSGFVFILRGPVSGFLSLCGGMLSLCAVILLLVILKKKLSYVTAGVSGAVAHNLGQYAAYSLILRMDLLLYYLPVLIISGIIMGVVTGVLLSVALPALNKINKF